MTTIVGYKTPAGVWLASDSRATHNHFIYPGERRKLYRFGGWGAGVCGSGRCQRLFEETLESFTTMVTPGALVDMFHAQCREIGLMQPNKDDGMPEVDMMLLLTNGAQLWEIGARGSVIEAPRFTAAGSGCDYAFGVLHALIKIGFDGCRPDAGDSVPEHAERLIRTAIATAAEFDTATGGEIMTLFVER